MGSFVLCWTLSASRGLGCCAAPSSIISQGSLFNIMGSNSDCRWLMISGPIYNSLSASPPLIQLISFVKWSENSAKVFSVLVRYLVFIMWAAQQFFLFRVILTCLYSCVDRGILFISHIAMHCNGKFFCWKMKKWEQVEYYQYLPLTVL